MSDGLNRVMLIGNMTEDGTLRFTQAGQAVFNIRMATNESYLDKDKVRRDRVEYHNVVIWGRRAEALSKLLAKGSRIYVEGALHTSSYDDRDGNKRYKVEISSSNIILLTGGGRGGSDDEDESESAEDAPRGGGGYSRGGGSGGGRPAGRSGGGGGADVVRFGRNNGQRFSEVEQIKDLEWYRDALEGNLHNPEKARYRDETLAAITALDEELASRGTGGGGAPRRSGGYSGGRGRGRAPAPAPVDPEQGGAPGEAYGEADEGYGNGPDDDIPF